MKQVSSSRSLRLPSDGSSPASRRDVVGAERGGGGRATLRVNRPSASAQPEEVVLPPAARAPSRPKEFSQQRREHSSRLSSVGQMVLRSGGALASAPTAFTSGAKHVLCPSGCIIKLFSCETGSLLRVLEGHTADVTSVVQSHSNPLQAITASLDGRIIVWDLEDAIVLRCLCLGFPLVAMQHDAACADAVYVLTGSEKLASAPTYAQSIGGADRVLEVSLGVSEQMLKRGQKLLNKAKKKSSEGAEEREQHARLGNLEYPWPAEVRTLFKVKGRNELAVGACGGLGGGPYVATISGPWMTAYNVATKGTLILQRGKEVRTQLLGVAVSPSELIAATSNDSGKIHLWRLDELMPAPPKRKPGGVVPTSADAAHASADDGATVFSRAPPLRELHWHAQRLSALTFSSDGAYLFSAGKEGVLVYWATHAAERAFLPRLGAPMSGIVPSADGSALALRGTDNALRIINVASRTVSRTIHGLRRATAMLADARLNCVMVYGAGANATLQWWAPRADAQMLSLQAAPTNLSGSLPAVGTDQRRRSYRDTAAAGGTAALCVTHAALSRDAQQLLTLESRADAELRQHTCLKFWSLKENTWSLVTRVPQPHAAEVTALAFHPTLLLALSAGRDAKFKLWEGRAPAAAAPPPDADAAQLATLGSAPFAVATAEPQPAETGPLGAGARLEGWGCRAVGYYRQSAATAAAFSADGSLLAVAYTPNVITLWDPLSTLLLSTLAQPLADAADSLCFVSFPADGGTLFAHSRRAFFCWSLLSGQLLWAYRAADVVAAAADPYSDVALVAVAVASNDANAKRSYMLLEFAANGARAAGTAADDGSATATPRRAWQLAHGTPTAVGFLPSAKGAGEPLCLTNKGELFALDDDDANSAHAAVVSGGASFVRRVPLQASLGKLTTIFGPPFAANIDDTQRALVSLNGSAAAVVGAAAGAAADASALPVVPDERAGWEARAIDAWMKRNLAAVPSHLLPPVRAIYPQLLHVLLRPAPHLADGVSECERVEEPLTQVEAVAMRKAVAAWAPALRRGFLTEKQRKAGGGGRLRDGGAAAATEEEADVTAEAELQPDSAELEEEALASGVLASRVRSSLKHKAAARAAAMEAEETPTAMTAAAPARALELPNKESASGLASWPPEGMCSLDMCGVPNPGFLVRDAERVRAEQRVGGERLSAADAAAWRDDAMSETEVERMADWMVEHDIGIDAGATLSALQGLSWNALDDEPDEIWSQLLGSDLLRDTVLPGGENSASIAEEAVAAAAAFAAAMLPPDLERGYGLQEGAMHENMCQPPTLGWQHEPDKKELKLLAKEYAQLSSEDAAKAVVLAAGLRTSAFPVGKTSVESY